MTKRKTETDLDYAHRLIEELQDRCDNMQKSIEGLVIQKGYLQDTIKTQAEMITRIARAAGLVARDF